MKKHEEMEVKDAIRYAKNASFLGMRRLFNNCSDDKYVCVLYRFYLDVYETLQKLPEEDFLRYCTDELMDCLQFLGEYLARAYCELMNQDD